MNIVEKLANRLIRRIAYKISIYETNNKDFDNNNFNEELEKKITDSFNKTLSGEEQGKVLKKTRN